SWLVQEQTALGKDKSNPLTVGSLLKTTWSSIHHLLTNKVLTSPEQTATGKDASNPFMAVMVCQKPLGYFGSPMIHVPRAELVFNPPGYVVPAGRIQVAQKKVKIAFENADSSLRIELIPLKIKYANKEEFIQAIQTFHTDKENMGSPTKKGRKDKPRVIPYCRFTKIIICHLGRIHNIHQRSASPFHLVKEDFRLGNLKFIPKGEIDEERKRLSAKQPKSKPIVKKASKPATAPKTKASKERPSKASADKPPTPKPAKEKSTKTTLPQPTSKGKVVKVRNAKSLFQLVDEPDEEPSHSKPELELVHQGEGDEDDMELAIRMSLKSFQAQCQAHIYGVAIREPVTEATRLLLMVKGKGKAIATEEQVAHSLLALHTPKRRSIMDQFVLQRRTPVTEEASTGPCAQAHDDTSVNIIRDSPSPANVEIGTASEKTNTGAASEKTDSRDETEILKIDEEQGKEEVMDEDQTVPNPRESCGALAGLDTESMHNKFMADLYPKVQESLKFSADEHVMLAEPLSSSRTLSSMKNLDRPEWLKPLPDNERPATPKPAWVIPSSYIPDRPEWLKPLPDNERPATLEPAWVIPSSHIPDVVNNWANALATTYQAPAENSLLEMTGDMRTFRHWYFQQMGKTEITQADFEGQTYKVVKGDQVRINVSKPLPLSGPPVPLTVYLIGGLIVKNSTLTDTLLTQAISDGTLTNIMEALDFRVKGYKVNRLNSGMNMRFGLKRMWQGARNLYMPLNEDSRPEGSSKTWNALLVVAYEILTTNCFREPNEHFISAFRSIF
nr:hypothetical protein [Tanacetum cinerariifolium]